MNREKNIGVPGVFSIAENIWTFYRDLLYNHGGLNEAYRIGTSTGEFIYYRLAYHPLRL